MHWKAVFRLAEHGAALMLRAWSDGPAAPFLRRGRDRLHDVLLGMIADGGGVRQCAPPTSSIWTIFSRHLLRDSRSLVCGT